MSTDPNAVPQTATSDSANTNASKSPEVIAQKWAINVAPEGEGGKSLAQMDEAELAAYVTKLYAEDGTLFSSYKRNRAKLAEALHFVKGKVSKPGKDGGWKPWLEAVHIPRSSADQLVKEHEVVLQTPASLRRAAEDAGINLHERAVVAELANINTELQHAEPAPSDVDGLVVRLGAAPLPKQLRKPQSSVSTYLGFGSLVSRFVGKLQPKSREDRCKDIETLVAEIAQKLGEDFEVSIKPRSKSVEAEANTPAVADTEAA